ncbi:hypothetical protein LJK88_10715 [Paenibacillus sp. P26]|nr:hypothetical protein LJK88_10715 [Paenibacillus sp. P26]
MAAAMLHRPQILFLDEPTIGLDVVVKHKIRELILEMNREEGTTVFLTSHDAGDIERLCRRSVVINHGRVIFDDTVDAMKRELLTGKTIRPQLLEPGEPFRLEGVEVLEQNDREMTLNVETTAISMEQALAHLVARYRVSDITIEDPPMEQIITYIYARVGHETVSAAGGANPPAEAGGPEAGPAKKEEAG